jgi:hypothetical protein
MMPGIGPFTAPTTVGDGETLLAAGFVLDFPATDFAKLAAGAGGLVSTFDFSSDETFFLVILLFSKLFFAQSQA